MTKYYGNLAFLNEEPFNPNDIPSASWLDDYSASTWVLNAGSDREVLKWDVTLYDGTCLTDPKNSYILEVMKRVIFESRNNYSKGRIVSVKRVKALHTTSMCFLDWVVAFGDIYQPRKYAFSMLDSDAIKSVIKIFVDRGASGLRLYESRFNRFFQSILNDKDEMKVALIGISGAPKQLIEKTNTIDNNTFTDDEIRLIKGWLYINGIYESDRQKRYEIRTGKTVYLINEGKIFNLIGVQGRTSSPDYLTLFLRQFESVEDYEHIYLVVRKSDTQYLPADYETVEEKNNKTSTMGVMMHLDAVLKSFQTMTPHINGLPSETVLSNIDFSSISKQFGAGGDSHHRTTPVSTALHLLGGSIDFLLGSGDGIVKLISKWSPLSCKIFTATDGVCTWTKLQSKEKALEKVKIPYSLKSLNINKVYSIYNTNKFERNEYGGHLGAVSLRRSFTLEDSVLFLASACFIIVATLAARRASELMELKKGCVKGSTGSYELEFNLRKAVVDGKRVILKRPIPNIAAKAIFTLEKLLKALGEDSNDSYIFQCLIDLKTNNRLPQINTVMKNINRFCDYIDIPLMDINRRWYPKSHEFRRFFAIVFFWQFKYSNLAAISWMLGHVDVEHTYAYIRETVGGKELTAEEARYSADAVLGQEEIDSLQQLRRLAINHFNCDDISLVEADELELYLEGLLEDNVFSVRPHAFETKCGTQYKMVFEIYKEA
jgi:hypothetical protein